MKGIDNGRDFAAIGRRLRALRLVLGKDQKHMSALAGVTPQAWSNWENGIRRPSPDQIYKLATSTGITADWVYYGDRSGLPVRIADGLSSLDEETNVRRAGR